MIATRSPDYCDYCYGQARMAGRPVRKVTIGGEEHEVCGQCESRLRNGLIHYRPSNGTEFEYFYERCGQCRHCIDDPNEPLPGSLTPPFKNCAWGVLDRLFVSMVYEVDHISNWFDPQDLTRHDAQGRLICPAECKRFTHKNDGDGPLRDPPKPDCEGQLFFSEVLTVPERIREMPTAEVGR